MYWSSVITKHTNNEQPRKVLSEVQQNISKAFESLREDIDFSDVTLLCEDDQHIEAHRVILTASSSLFQNLLLKNKHAYPVMSQMANTLLQGPNPFISFPKDSPVRPGSEMLPNSDHISRICPDLGQNTKIGSRRRLWDYAWAVHKTWDFSTCLFSLRHN